MSIPTVAVTIESAAITGAPVANGSAILQLNAMDVVAGTGGATVGTAPITVALDVNGQATPNLFPNAVQTGLGTRGTQYIVTLLDANGNQVGSGLATIPNEACNLHDHLDSVAPMSLTDGQVAVNLARSYRDQAEAVLTDSGFVAVKNDLPNIDTVAENIESVDQVATNIGAVETAATNMAAILAAPAQATTATLEAQAAAGSAAITQGLQLTATAMAAAAYAYAQSAASVAQQDLSGVTGAALLRSPNAIVGIAHCDTSKDSDGGSWTQRCEDHSFYTESLVGAWIYSTLAGFMGFGAGNSSGTQTVNTPEIVARAMGGTLGANIATGAWASMDGGTVTGSAANFTVTPAAGHFDGAQMTVATTPGASYLVTGVVSGANQGRIYINGTASLTSPYANAGALQGGFAFVVTAPGAQLVLMPGSNVAAQGVAYSNFSVQPVTAWAPSGSYYPDATTGKFQRLWKNLLANPLDLSQATWTKLNVTPTYNAIANPVDGTVNAALFVDNATSGAHGFSATPSITNVAAEGSVYVKAYGNLQRIALLLENGGQAYAYFDINGAAPGTSTGNSGTCEVAAGISITSLGSGWYRISNGYNGSGSGRLFVYCCQGATNNPSYVGDGTSGFYAYAPQFELGSLMTTAETGKTVSDGAGTTEVFRGSKARPFRYGIAPTESGFLTIFDALEPGRPMWMRFVANVAGNAIPGSIVGNLVYVQGGLLVGTNAGLVYIDLAGDRVFNWGASGLRRYRGKIADRNAGLGWDVVDSTKVVSNTVAMIAACLMPDAPVDTLTGLQVPTLAATTSTVGAVLIHNNGTVVNSSTTGSWNAITLTPWLLTFSTTSLANIQYAFQPGKLGANFATTSLSTTNPQMTAFGANGSSLVSGGRSMLFRRLAANRLQGMRFNEATLAGSPCFDLSDTYNTGWMVDPKRAYLCDTDVGSIGPSAELIANGTWAGTTSWTVEGTATGVSTSGGQLTGTTGGATNCLISEQITGLTIGKKYYVTMARVSGSTGIYIGNAAGSNLAYGSATPATGTVPAIVGFRATTTSVWVNIVAGGAFQAITVGTISMQEGVLDRSYKGAYMREFGTGLVASPVAAGAQLVALAGFSSTSYLQEPTYSSDLDFATGQWRVAAWVSFTTAVASTIVERSFSSGAYITLGTDSSGHFTATAYDGTSTLTVTTTQTYNTGVLLKVAAQYTTDGSLTILVDGQQVAQTVHAPLLTLNNANAVLTIGQNYALTAPFPGSIALVRIGTTVPTADASAWMYEQEKQMFVAGAQVTLPDSGSVVGGDWDDSQGKFKAVSAANESSFVGVVRTAFAAVPAGTFTGVAHRSGIRLVARSNVNPGVDITLPALNLKEELNRREEVFARRVAANEEYDWTPTFTANTTNGLSQVTVTSASLVYPVSAPPVGALVTGAGIQAGTRILGISGTTLNLSLPCTATATGVTVSLLSFPLPQMYETRSVVGGGSLKREGSGFDYQRQFDGFREAPVFTSGLTGFVRVSARRVAP